MANLLYRLGRFAARRAWVMIGGWLALLAIAIGAFLGFGGSLAGSFSIPGTATERVNQKLAADLPELTGATGMIVIEAQQPFNDAQRTAIAELGQRISEVDGVARVTDPFQAQAQREGQLQQLQAGRAQLDAARAAGAPADDQNRAQLDAQAAALADGEKLAQYAQNARVISEDGRTALLAVSFTEDMFGLQPTEQNAVREIVEQTSIPGLTLSVDSIIASTAEGIIGVGEIIGLIVAAIVLGVMMRAFLPAVTPLVTSLVGVGVGVAASMAFSGTVDMATVTPVLGIMLGLAVGIDYSLFVLNRHRSQLRDGVELHESIGLANGTSGNAVVFAGATVVVALLALGITGIPFLAVMGVVGAVCVAVAVLVTITLTPALLGLMGMRVLSSRQRANINHGHDRDTSVRPAQPMSTVRAIGSVALAVLALVVIAIPALSMRLGLPDGSAEATDSSQYIAYKAVEKNFGPGSNGSLLVVADTPEPVTEATESAVQAKIAGRLFEQDNVSAVVPIVTSSDARTLVFQVVPSFGPTAQQTEDLVDALRSLPVEDGVELGVAGQASGNIDVSAKLSAALPVYLAVVVGLSLLILVVVFRSILVPVIATSGYILSLLAALGAMTAVYQWGWLGSVFGVHDTGPVLSFAPIVITGVLFGLAMDYQLFLVSGMREAYVHGASARSAVMAGLSHGRAVVTAAAIIMISVFGGFVFSHLGMIRPLGFGLAIGVLFDAFAVRMVIVPAVMHLVGDKAWWLPRWLDKILPDVDIEGAALERAHGSSAAGGDTADAIPADDAERQATGARS